jgi:hypothetical protein
MNCPKCGTDNPPKNLFCIKCGCNLKNPEEINIEQLDMGGYRSEEDYSSEKNSFRLSGGTFTIKDKAPSVSNGMFTADELESDEDFDFSSFDEPSSPNEQERNSFPQNGYNSGQPNMYGMMNQPMQNPNMQGMMNQPVQNPNMQGMMNQPVQNPNMQGMMNQPVQNPNMQGMMNQPMQNPNMQGMMNQPVQNPNMQGMNPYGGQMYGMMPPIMGYDQNGMPVYAQPQQMMYAQPQLVGYDQNGMPIYAQPQPVMYMPQFIGYDQNGMPVYAQPQQMMYSPNPVQQPVYPNAYPNMQQPVNNMGMMNTPYQNPMYGNQPPQNVSPEPEQKEEPAREKDEFWDSLFTDDEEKNQNDSSDDFFSKPSHSHSDDMGSVSTEGLDMSLLKRHEKTTKNYMGDTPDVDAGELTPNRPDELNKFYMGATAAVNADDLEAKKPSVRKDKMGMTETVNADSLETFERKKSSVTMSQTEQTNADELQAYKHEHKQALMDAADHAVEALPTKKTSAADEIDAIELPEYMQAKKTIHNETPEIPDIPPIN